MKPILYLSFLSIFFYACSKQPTRFQLLEADQTGIDFINSISTTDNFNAIFFEYVYNGAGVAASDVNGDGLTDLFFTGNQVSCKLYLNRGDLQFEDVSLPAQVQTDRWCTGVAIADVNGDGRKDIYLSVAGFQVKEEQMENLLFINLGWDKNGVPKFEESAAQYGLNDNGYSTQAAFFDYDLDGDLDLYLLTNALEKYHRNNLRPKRINGEGASTDRLYQNNGDETFTNVSEEAGILIEGYGLGIGVADLNLDGLPDIYTANDFLSNDLIWVNNGDGTFTNRAAEYTKHQTHNGMGVDIADLNNDALPDIAVLDMLPADNYRQKMMIPYLNYDQFKMKQKLGYQDQYMRNTLQLHQGFSPNGFPQFSEIGNLAGLSATDWSWSILFADFDNDGWKDAYITNGYRKDVTNLDYVNYSPYNQVFGTKEAKIKKAVTDLEQTPDVAISNYLFQNKGNLQFENVTKNWGLERASFSNGAVYTDLDHDGDLDLVVNNIDSEAFLFENTSNNQTTSNHYLQVVLEEQQSKLTTYNTKVVVYMGNDLQYQEFSPFKGYKSTMDDVLHFGLGDLTQVDSVVVFWLDGTKTVVLQPQANQRITIKHEVGQRASSPFAPKQTKKNLFQAVNEKYNIHFQHLDNDHSDLRTTRTLPHDHSKSGPAIATGDINGDGLEDFFVGGNKEQSGVCFLQRQDNTFSQYLFPHDPMYQDTDALLFDADGDGDQDLYVVSGGTFESTRASLYQDRLYLNDGQGSFLPAPNALPTITASGGCVRAADFDQDGDLDLFVGGRIIPNQYPLPPRSYLFENEAGKFTDITPAALQNIGLVSDAIWTDFNHDQQIDLILVGEWMPITVFENRSGNLAPIEIVIDRKSNKTNGWWMHINAADIDQDGDMDFLLGNLGLNSTLKATQEEPVKLYVNDFDHNGAIDPLLTHYLDGKEYVLHERDLLLSQIPAMKRRFPNYEKYAVAPLAATLLPQELESTMIYQSYELASIILENQGDQHFVQHQLPRECQLSPITGSLFNDFDQNGKLDLLTAGNYQATETTQIGWYDASYGNILFQNEAMKFQASNTLNYDLQADGDIRTVKHLKLASGQTLLLFGVYGGDLQAYLY